MTMFANTMNIIVCSLTVNFSSIKIVSIHCSSCTFEAQKDEDKYVAFLFN